MPARRGSTFAARKDWNEGEKTRAKDGSRVFCSRTLDRSCGSLPLETCPRDTLRLCTVPSRCFNTGTIKLRYYYIFVATFLFHRSYSLSFMKRSISKSVWTKSVFFLFTYAREFCLEINLIVSISGKFFSSFSFTFLTRSLIIRKIER